MIKLVLDPGHGGTDPGARGNNLIEKTVNLNIALRVGQILNSRYKDYFEVELTRTRDVTVNLSERVDRAHRMNADWFISIHTNAAGSSAARGYEDYRHPAASALSQDYHKIIHLHVSSTFARYNSPNRGMKTANFHVLRETRMPATLLECGFLTNEADAALLSNSEFLDVLSNSIVSGILDVFDIPEHENVYLEQHLDAIGNTLETLQTQFKTLEKKVRGSL